MSTMSVTTIIVSTDQNVPVATMIYPLVAIVAFCSSAPECPHPLPCGTTVHHRSHRPLPPTSSLVDGDKYLQQPPNPNLVTIIVEYTS
jgi:hypothetical protein